MDLLYQSDYDIIQNYDIIDCYIIYNITYDECGSRSSPLPGLILAWIHSDSARSHLESTPSTAGPVQAAFYCSLSDCPLRAASKCGTMLCYAMTMRSGPVRRSPLDPPGFEFKTLLIK